MASRHSGRAINFYFLFLVVHKEDDSQNRKKFQVSTGRRIVIGYFTFKWGFENSKKKGGGGMCERLIIWMAFGIYDFLHLIRFLWPPFFFISRWNSFIIFPSKKRQTSTSFFRKIWHNPPPPNTHTHTHKRVVVRFTIDSIFFRHPCQQQSSQAT